MQSDETVVTYPGWAWVLVWAGFPLLGAGLGWGLKSAAGWVAGLQWAPFQGPFKLVASIKEPHATIGALAVGAVAGLVLAFLSAQDTLKVTVANDSVHLRRGSEEGRDLGRSAVQGVFIDAKHLVLLGSGGMELAREKSDLEERDLAAAFEKHGWPWLAADPHAGEYRRWVQDEPDLPAGANALLKVRAKAVSKDDAADISELRVELSKLGVVVRDDRKKQYWRTVTR